MYAAIQFILNTCNTISIWIYSNPVCCIGLFAVGFHVFVYCMDKIRKLV